MKRFRCGFYCNPLNWTVKANTQQEAAIKFAKMIKRKNLKAQNGETNFVVIEVSEKGVMKYETAQKEISVGIS